MWTAGMVVLALLSSPVPAAAETRPLKRLPGDVACAYPPLAESNLVAGPVLFVARVRPGGSVESVDVRRVPAKGLGFEEAVRACVSRWRFEPILGEGGLRQYEGEIRYRVAASDEAAIRSVLEAFAAAWNARSSEAIGDLTGEGRQPEATGAGSPPSSVERFTTERSAADWTIELEPGFQHVQFLRPDVAVVSQPFRKEGAAGAGGPAKGSSSLLEATARKRGHSWKLLAWYPLAGPPRAGRWLFPGIEEPRKVRHVEPVYPDVALEAPVSAVVTLEAEVDASGRVAAVRFLQGGRPFDEPAMRAVRQWEYAPTLLEGVPIPIVIRVDVPSESGARCPRCAVSPATVH